MKKKVEIGLVGIFPSTLLGGSEFPNSFIASGKKIPKIQAGVIFPLWGSLIDMMTTS